MKRILILLMIVGCVLFVVGLYITTLDFVSCPSEFWTPNGYGCVHAWMGRLPFSTTGIIIPLSPIGIILSIVGAILLLTDLSSAVRKRH